MRSPEAILAQYTRPGQWVYVGGFGAGGDIRVGLNAGLNVVAIEKDPAQFHATVANMRSFVPDSNLCNVHTHEQLVFGCKNMQLADDDDEDEGQGRKCVGCHKSFTKEMRVCTMCGDGGCPKCFFLSADGLIFCGPCRLATHPPAPSFSAADSEPVPEQKPADPGGVGSQTVGFSVCPN